jgi:hypothetical protein
MDGDRIGRAVHQRELLECTYKHVQGRSISDSIAQLWRKDARMSCEHREWDISGSQIREDIQ